MAYISLDRITFAYPGSYDNVFTNLDLHWDSSWRLGLVGRNGRGKTTLLRLLRGEFACQGRIQSPAAFVSFPQDIPDPSLSVGELARALAGDDDWQAKRELFNLGLSDAIWDQPFSLLSGGEQTKVQLALLFAKGGVYPLIDEPTNHLDLAGRRLVGEYLAQQSGFLLVSHDRALLDRCTDHIVALERSKVRITKGNFSQWEENKEREDQWEQAADYKLRQEIKRLRQAARQAASWSDKVEKTRKGTRISGVKASSGYIGARSARMMRRAKSAEQRQEKAAEEKSALLHNIESAELLPIRYTPYFTTPLLRVEQAGVSYGGREIFSNRSFTLERGERLALTGANGSGKSSLLKLIAGEMAPQRGRVSRGSQLRVSYVPQHTSALSGGWRDFIDSSQVDETLFKTILRKLGLERVQFDKDLDQLSEGQKKKILLARSLAQEAELYVWDEPLNYIDLFSRRQVEDILLLTQPSMVLVEHDEAFITAIANRELRLG